jgi:hypothetical protein
MAVDLGELIETLEREVTPLGTAFAGTEDEALGHLQDAFWAARMRGAFEGYTEADGEVTPINSTDPDLPREQQQLIVLAAGIRIVRSALRNANTVFRAQAGPVQFETQQSAQTLRELLVQLDREFRQVLDYVVHWTDSGTVAYFDALIQRTDSIAAGNTWFPR